MDQKKKRKKSQSPTSRTLAWLRDRGYVCGITEKWNAYVRRRQDLFGFIDLIAISNNLTIGVQATDGSSVSHREAKIMSLAVARLWVAAPGRCIWVVGWRRLGTVLHKRWSIRIIELKVVDGEWVRTELVADDFPKVKQESDAPLYTESVP